VGSEFGSCFRNLLAPNLEFFLCIRPHPRLVCRQAHREHLPFRVHDLNRAGSGFNLTSQLVVGKNLRHR